MYLYETFQQEQYSATESQQLPLQLVEIIAEGQNFRQAADDNEAHLKEKKMVSTLLCKYGSSTLSKVSILGVVALCGDCKNILTN